MNFQREVSEGFLQFSVRNHFPFGAGLAFSVFHDQTHAMFRLLFDHQIQFDWHGREIGMSA